ncbi:unnamed protein product [Rotaria sordida]|uniref:Uncharacterized protein n=1 Tax=Rotaria sordida TaxID=392033 RepID=A0A813Q8H8_9BILA|nr:unnamed protein product [Rotaria sordida]
MLNDLLVIQLIFSSSTDPSNASIQVINVQKELCEVYERKEIDQPVTLIGPYSPLEANHSSCHYATKMRRVQIDDESINSVGLEEEQHCHYRCLLVAFDVHLSQTRQIVSLRHTILMPSIREFNPVTNTSLYPDYDMDIGFDVQISTEALVRINEIRKQINLALYSAESAGNKDLMRSVRRTTTTKLQKLLEAKRPPNRNNYFGTFQWNRLNPDDRVPQMTEDVSPDHLKLFPLHDDVITCTVEINDEHRLKMIYHLIWLREKATITTFMCQITCQLCDMNFNFTSDLFAHLSSSQSTSRTYTQEEVKTISPIISDINVNTNIHQSTTSLPVINPNTAMISPLATITPTPSLAIIPQV